MDETLLPLSRAARRCGVSTAWLKAEAQSGRVPCLPAGKGKILFDITALVATLKERARQPVKQEAASCV